MTQGSVVTLLANGQFPWVSQNHSDEWYKRWRLSRWIEGLDICLVCGCHHPTLEDFRVKLLVIDGEQACVAYTVSHAK